MGAGAAFSGGGAGAGAGGGAGSAAGGGAGQGGDGAGSGRDGTQSAGQGGQGGSAPPPPAAWHTNEKVTPEVRGFLQNKGWFGDDPVDVIGKLTAGYQGAEKLIGADGKNLLRRPDPNDAEAVKKFRMELGMPDKPEGYEFQGYKPPEGEGSYDLVPVFRGWAHELGLSSDQARGLVEKFQPHMQEVGEKMMAEEVAKVDEAFNAWRAELGEAKSTEMIASAQAFARRYGIADEQVQTILAAVGPKLWATITHEVMPLLGEQSGLSLGGEGGGGGRLAATPEQAIAKIQELTFSKEFQKRMGEKDPAARRQWDELHRIAYPTT